MLTKNDDTGDIPTDVVSELTGTHFDQQPHTYHMVTGQSTQTNQITEFLTGNILTPHDRRLHQHPKLLIQVSQDNNLPRFEQTARNQISDSNNSNKPLVEAIVGIATQQRPQAATMLPALSTKTLIFDGRNEKIEHFEDLFHTKLKMQPKKTEAMKIKHFRAN